MIQDQQYIIINEPPETVFGLIETMPNKFPVYKIMETKPFLVLRILLVDGLDSAIKMIKHGKTNDMTEFNVGDSMGPFELTDVDKPLKYLFTLKSFFFNCQTGYTLSAVETGTKLNFILVADNPKLSEKLYWYIVKPFHLILAKKVLKTIKSMIESKDLSR